MSRYLQFISRAIRWWWHSVQEGDTPETMAFKQDYPAP